MIKAVGLFSGGLDSILAVKLMKEQGIEIDVLHYDIGFESLKMQRQVKKRDVEVSREALEHQLGLNIQDIDVTEEFLQVVLHPKHGYGSEMNPCIDCKIFIFQCAKEYMQAHQAHFVFTGEVVGQRPMSQHRQTLRKIENASGLSGYLLRPLSAKLLEATIPEQQGWVDREQLLDISGRSRQVQLALARKYHLRYQQPAGGCLLNDPYFSVRLQDLIRYKPEEEIDVGDTALLKLGRHFRLSDTLKIIIGRHEVDNTLLDHYTEGRWTAEVRDYGGPLVVIDGEPTAEQCEVDNTLLDHYTEGRWTAEVRDYGGPLVVIDGEPTAEQCELIAQITVKFTKAKHEDRVTVDFARDNEQLAVTIIPEKHLDPLQWRIG
jgi:tRNA U34 2-thiouridine synthase MnmA/TrmU